MTSVFKRRLRKRRALAGLTRLLIVLSASNSPLSGAR
jgi:hypothetical protein